MKKLLLLIIATLFFITNSCSDSPNTLNIMTYNIRLDVEDDGLNQWDKRKKGLVYLIKEEDPDILGIQEGLPNQIEYLLEQLEEYSMIGEGRNGGNNGEYSAIYYKNKKLRLEKDETFWLSETPGKPSIGWDAALNRIATVGVFATTKYKYIWIHRFAIFVNIVADNILVRNSFKTVVRYSRCSRLVKW